MTYAAAYVLAVFILVMGEIVVVYKNTKMVEEGIIQITELTNQINEMLLTYEEALENKK